VFPLSTSEFNFVRLLIKIISGLFPEKCLRIKKMKRENLIAFLKAHGAEIRGYGVKSLALFGSVARDEATAKSDIDLLVEFEGKVTFDCYMDLKFFRFG
jgi:hypothetical protein